MTEAGSALAASAPNGESLAERYAELRRKVSGAPDRERSRAELSTEALVLATAAADIQLGQRPYPTQVLGALCLGDRRIVEIRTGDGKTLSCALAASAWALGGPVHLATANDYLARRDALAMQPLYAALGLTVAAVCEADPLDTRREAYRADIVYSTARQLGFDYLNDAVSYDVDTLVAPGARYAVILDEADNLLLDEAVTPLIISRPIGTGTEGDLLRYAAVAAALTDDDVQVDHSLRLCMLTERGSTTVAGALGVARLTDDQALTAGMNTALAARFVYRRDRDYLVVDPTTIGPDGRPYGQTLVVVDAHTGRVASDRRFQNGLHEALEAKERVEGTELTLGRRPVTIASTTMPSFLALYSHTAGTTGTALDDADEFAAVYGLEVVTVPPHRTPRRDDLALRTYLTREEKYRAIVAEAYERMGSGQPVLVACETVEESEAVNAAMLAAGLVPVLLNAREHTGEAETIARAGEPGRVTVATLMAGRGVHVELGGAEPASTEIDDHATWLRRRQDVERAGGLCVLAASRFASRRLDNQVRGRTGRQGDPGVTIAFASMQDELAATFGADNVAGTLSTLMSSSDATTGPIPAVGRLIEQAQRRQEALTAAARRAVAEIDAPYRDQREAFYRLRREILHADSDLAPLLVAVPYWALARRTGEILTSDDELAMELRTRLDTVFAELRTREQDRKTEGNIVRTVALQELDRAWATHLEQLDLERGLSALARYEQRDGREKFASSAAEAWEPFMYRACQQTVEKLSSLTVRLEDAS